MMSLEQSTQDGCYYCGAGRLPHNREDMRLMTMRRHACIHYREFALIKLHILALGIKRRARGGTSLAFSVPTSSVL